MPDDIRDAPVGEYWDRFERRWTGLLSYRYLGRTSAALDRGGGETMRLRHDMRNPSGGVMAAPLCIASPESGGMADDAYVPNPVVASLHILDDARDVGEIEVRREVIRIGRRMGFSRSQIVDAADPERVIALSEGMGVSLGEPPPGFEPVDNPPIAVEDSADLPPLHVVFGARRRPDGAWELPELNDELSSPDAALHLGPIHVVLEAAAMELSAREAATDALQIEDWHVMFVARGKVGPFRVGGDATSGGLGRIGCRLSLRDEGNGDRVVSTASAAFRPAS
ncbi:MAG TPA: hypothetical protein VFG94_13220 [Acidimicrobiales bacterium]|nr:hypothetical protein [Acidimicrobiales bacterium]